MTTTISGSEVLTHIEEKVTAVLKRRGVAPAIVAAAAIAVSDGIAQDFGGLLVYFKKQSALNAEERNLAIAADFETGDYTHSELAQKYGISVQQIYKIIKNNKKEKHESNP